MVKKLPERLHQESEREYVVVGTPYSCVWREVIEFAIGGGWGKVTPFKGSAPVHIVRGTDFNRIRNGDFRGVPARYEKSSKVKRRILRPGDIILEISGGSRSSNQSTGRSLFISTHVLKKLGAKVIPASFCRLVRVNPRVVDPQYAYYSLQEMYRSKRAALYEQQSTGISNFQFAHFLDSEVICCRPLSEQRTIAHILGTLDDKIDLNRRMNKTLEAMAQAIFKDWFVDFGPTRAKAEGRAPYLAPELWELFPDALDGEGKPVGWEVSLLGERIEILDFKRIPLSSRERKQRQGPYPYHGATGVMDHVDDFLFEGVHVLLGEDGSVVKPNGKPFTRMGGWENTAHPETGGGIRPRRPCTSRLPVPY